MKGQNSHQSAFLVSAALCLLAVVVNSQVVTMDLPTPVSMVGPSVSLTVDQYEAAVAAMAAAAPADATVTPQQSSLFDEILYLHNNYRLLHGVGVLTWSNTLATSSAAWAKQCKWEHSVREDFRGENLYATSDRSSQAAALAAGVKAWYDEIKLYDYNKPGWSAATGHFTQVIWKATTQIGCAIQDCSTITNAGFGGLLVVCQYLPPGNIMREDIFRANVLPVGGGGPAPPTSPNPGGGGGVVYDPKTAIPAKTMLPAPKCITATNQKHRLCVLGTGDVQIQSLTATGRWRRTWNTGVRAPAGSTRPFALGLWPDGNLAAFDKNQKIYWETKTAGVGVTPHVAVLRDTGNLILYDNTGKCIWSAKPVAGCARRRSAERP